MVGDQILCKVDGKFLPPVMGWGTICIIVIASWLNDLWVVLTAGVSSLQSTMEYGL